MKCNVAFGCWVPMVFMKVTEGVGVNICLVIAKACKFFRSSLAPCLGYGSKPLDQRGGGGEQSTDFPLGTSSQCGHWQQLMMKACMVVLWTHEGLEQYAHFKHQSLPAAIILERLSLLAIVLIRSKYTQQRAHNHCMTTTNLLLQYISVTVCTLSMVLLLHPSSHCVITV